LKRFILNSGPERNGKVRLEGDDFHYLVRVRRLAPGECFPALTPGGDKVVIKIRSTDGGVLAGECVAEDAAGANSPQGLPPLILFQALPKGEKMDLIVRQAAEAGLAEIVPFRAEFSVPKINAKEKYKRWQRIVKEARQQSGSSTASEVRPPMQIEELFAYWEKLKLASPGILGFLFHQIPLEKTSLHGYLDRGPIPVVLAIGPEGGFSPAEVSRFLEAGFKSIALGETVLRTETAALYGTAAIRTILLEKDSWELKKH
jgi:16S rRNA (uracil1498-N3)-methyltransferase